MRKTRATGILAIVVLSLGCVIAAAQQQPAAIEIEGLDGAKLTLTVEQLRQMPQQSVSMVNPHTKSTEKYEGVRLADVLAKAGRSERRKTTRRPDARLCRGHRTGWLQGGIRSG